MSISLICIFTLLSIQLAYQIAYGVVLTLASVACAERRALTEGRFGIFGSHPEVSTYFKLLRLCGSRVIRGESHSGYMDPPTSE